MNPRFKLLFSAFLLWLSFSGLAQQNVGIGTLTPNTKSILDLESTAMGFLMPRMTSPQRVAIFPGPADEGLIVYDITLDVFQYWNGAAWVPVGGGGSDNDWTITANNQFSAVTGNVGIGVTLPQAKFHVNGSLIFENLPAGSSNNVMVITPTGTVGTRSLGNDIWDGDDINDADSNPTNELNTNLYFNPQNNTLSITDNGGTQTTTIFFATGDADLDSTNEIQNLSSSVNPINETVTVDISGGNSTTFSIKDDDADPTNEIQTLNMSQTGDTINWSMSNNGGAGSFLTSDVDWIGAGSGMLYPVNAGDNVGIGRSNAYFNLDVNGNIRVVNKVYFDSTSYYIEKRTDDLYFYSENDFKFVTGQGHIVRYYHDNTEARVNFNLNNQDVLTLRGDDGGFFAYKVGIGTNVPSSKLHVAGDIRVGDINAPGFTNGGSNYGSLIHLSGGPGYTLPANYTSENNDPLFIARFNSGPDLSEIRISVGDDTEGINNIRDRLSIGAIAPGGLTIDDYASLFQFEINNSTTTSNEPMLSISPYGTLHITSYHGGVSITKPDTSNGQYINLVREGAGTDWSIGYQYITNDFAIGKAQTVNSSFTNPEFTILASTGYVGLGINNPSERLTLPNSGSGLANAWTTYSDGRFKKNRNELPEIIDYIMKLSPLTYQWEDFKYNEDGEVYGLGSINPKREYGFIAQDMYKLFPELVNRPENEKTGTWSMDYPRLTVLLTKAIQEQQIMLNEEKVAHETTKAELNELKSILGDLNNRVNLLEVKTSDTRANK